MGGQKSSKIVGHHLCTFPKPFFLFPIVSGALKPRNDVVMQTLCPKDILKSQIMYPPILVEDFVKERVKLHYPQYLEDKNEGQKDPEFIQTLQNEIKGYQI